MPTCLAVQDQLLLQYLAMVIFLLEEPVVDNESVSKRDSNSTKSSSDGTFGDSNHDGHGNCNCSQQATDSKSPPGSAALTPPPNGTLPLCLTFPTSLYGSRIWPPNNYYHPYMMPTSVLSAPRPPMFPLRDGLPPVPPLVTLPSPTSPEDSSVSTPFVFPKSTPVIYNGAISPSSPSNSSAGGKYDLDPRMSDAFKRAASTEPTVISPRKRDHSPVGNHFRYGTYNDEVLPPKKRSFAVAEAYKNDQIMDRDERIPKKEPQSPDRPAHNPAGSPGIPEHNPPGSPIRSVHNQLTQLVPQANIVPRQPKREPVPPARLVDYEVPSNRSQSNNDRRIHRVPKRLPTAHIKFEHGQAIKNGHVIDKDLKESKKQSVAPNQVQSPNALTSVARSLSPKSTGSVKDERLSPVSPTSLLKRGFDSPVINRTRRVSSSSTDSGTEEPREGSPRHGSPAKSPTHVKKPGRRKQTRSLHLWEFLKELLENEDTCPRYITWISRDEGVFRLVNSGAVAKLWGLRKNRRNMNYEKMSRALRYYYERHILERVPGQRLIYKFAADTMRDCNFSFMKNDA